MRGSKRRMIREMMEVIVEDCPRVAPPWQAKVHDDVVGLVSSQIEAMPTHLRHPYSVGLLAFHYLPVLRYGRPFRHLSAARKASYLRSWSNGRLGMARDFLRLMRSCVLLAYLDHELVRSRSATPKAANANPSEVDRATPGRPSADR